MSKLSTEHFKKTLEIYRRAWETQDCNLILTIFTETATYHERLLEAPMRGHAGIRRYWQSKVVDGQANIRVQILSTYIDGNTGIAEWEAEFDDKEESCTRFMREIAIMEFDNDKIRALREYWVSKRTGPL